MTKEWHSRLAITFRSALGGVVLLAVVGLIANQVASQQKPPPAPAGQDKKPAPPERKPVPPEKKPVEEKRPPAPASKPSAPEPRPTTQPAGPTPEEAAQIEQMMKDLASPGENHQRLDPLVGSWEVVMRSWPDGPDRPPVESKGLSQVRWILGGRFVSEESLSDLLLPNPETGKEEKISFQGQGLTGYDNYKNLYFSVWVDNTGTQMFICRGACDASGQVITMYGEMDDAMIGVHGRMMKMVTRILDRDKHMMELYDLYGGADTKMLEMVYTRKK
jgi:hypothetical protein